MQRAKGLSFNDQQSAYDAFRAAVHSGDVTDPYGNKMVMYRPDRDTFFACLSFALSGSAQRRVDIRLKLLRTAVTFVTGKKCDDVRTWSRTANPGKFKINERCVDHPAIDSLATSIGGPKNANDRAQWILGDLRFRQGFCQFISANLENNRVWCKYALAYLFCTIYSCDIYMYSYDESAERVRRIASICKKSSYLVRDKQKNEESDMTMVTKDELEEYAGVELVSPRGQVSSNGSAPGKVVHFSADGERSKSRSNADDLDSSDETNWFAIYLLYVVTENSRKFELCYTDNEVALDGNVDWKNKHAKYSLRTCEHNADTDEYQNKPLRKGGAICSPPPNRRRVHLFRFDSHERRLGKFLQLGPVNLRPPPLNGKKKTFIYLYYRDRGQNGTALMVKRVDPTSCPGFPIFLSSDTKFGSADGVFVVNSASDDRAHNYVECEMRVAVEMPMDFEEEDEEDE